jgi:hypothetical protein
MATLGVKVKDVDALEAETVEKVKKIKNKILKMFILRSVL